ncbi:MAG: LPS export ABC transporter permease LptF [Deltaproteobacteria bacterium]|nr:LPS export ABC transporter permease LptF [Deltaproteobacteria bacterium]
MKINRYITGEIIVPFFLGLGIFIFILLMDKVLNLTELVVSKGVRFSEALSLIIYILPSFLVIAIPMAFLLAVLLAFGRLSTDEEITAAKSSGISLLQMLPPVMVLSVIAFIVTLGLMIYALPWGNHSFKSKLYELARREASTSIVPGKVLDSFSKIILYVNEEDKSTGRYKGVLISDEKKGGKKSMVIAKEGEIISSPDDFSIALRLYDGTIHRKDDKEDLKYGLIKFKTYDITLSIESKGRAAMVAPKGDRELSIGELMDKSKKLREKGLSDDYLMVELHKKFSIPFACIVFALIGAPLGIQGKRSGKAHGFIFSLILITVYYIFLMAGEAFGDKGKVPPYLAMWAPNIFFVSIGIYLLYKVNNDSEIKLLSIFEALYGMVAKSLQGIFKREK